MYLILVQNRDISLCLILCLATKYIFFTLCWLIKLYVNIVVIDCKAPISG